MTADGEGEMFLALSSSVASEIALLSFLSGVEMCDNGCAAFRVRVGVEGVLTAYQ